VTGIKKIFFSVLISFAITLVIFLIVFVCLIIGRQILILENKEYSVNFFGSFSGAFFAFLFISVASSWDKLFQRRSKHRTAVIALEWRLIRYIETADSNRQQIEECIKSIQTSGFRVFDFRQFNIDILIDALLNIDLKNDIFDLYTRLEKLNADYGSYKQFYTSANLENPKLDVLSSLEKLNRGHLIIDQDMEFLLAKILCILDSPKLLDRIIGLFAKAEKYPKNIKELANIKLISIKQSRDETRKMSKKR